MKRLTSGLAIGTVALFAATGFALAQSAPDAAASGSPSAAPSESTAPAETAAPMEAPAQPSTQQTSPSDRPTQAGGMHNTSDVRSNSKSGCERKPVQSTSEAPAKASNGCEKPR